MVRKAPQLLKLGELDYIIQTARDGNECRLIEHIQAMTIQHEKDQNVLQEIRLVATTADGFKPVIKLARIRMIADKALRGDWL